MNTYNWEIFPKSQIYQDILSEWNTLLADTSNNEQVYQTFLQNYPAIFLTTHGSYLVISKVKLGSEYETDFVIVEEGYSDGTIYEIIEIESPHTKLFDQKGKPTSKFNSALQQIRDWKRWLIKNKQGFSQTFPTVSTKILQDSRIRFKIIIGKRTDNKEEIEKRQQIADQEGIEICSFDRLTDIATWRKSFSNTANILAGQMRSVSFELKNDLANPFYKCISDSDWRSICKKGHYHIYSNLLREILALRTYNNNFERYKLVAKTGLTELSQDKLA